MGVKTPSGSSVEDSCWSFLTSLRFIHQKTKLWSPNLFSLSVATTHGSLSVNNRTKANCAKGVMNSPRHGTWDQRLCSCLAPAVVDGGPWSLHQRGLDRNLLPSAKSQHFCLNGGSSEIKSFSTPYRWRTCCVFRPAEVLNLLSAETARSHPFVFNSEHCCLNCIPSPPLLDVWKINKAWRLNFGVCAWFSPLSRKILPWRCQLGN